MRKRRPPDRVAQHLTARMLGHFGDGPRAVSRKMDVATSTAWRLLRSKPKVKPKTTPAPRALRCRYCEFGVPVKDTIGDPTWKALAAHQRRAHRGRWSAWNEKADELAPPDSPPE